VNFFCTEYKSQMSINFNNFWTLAQVILLTQLPIFSYQSPDSGLTLWLSTNLHPQFSSMYVLPIITKTVIIFTFGALVFSLHSTNINNRRSLIIPCDFGVLKCDTKT